MKKLIQLVFFSILCNVALGQQSTNQAPFKPGQPKPLTQIYDPTNSVMEQYKQMHGLTRNPGDGANWYNYGLGYAGLIGKGPYYYILPLFPDTDIVQYTYIDSSGNRRNQVPNYHAAATILDPYNFIPGWGGTQFALDSLWIKYLYTRATDVSIVDTMVITILQSKVVNYALIGKDTVWWKRVNYNYLTNSVDTSMAITKIKYPLRTQNASVVTDLNNLNITQSKDIFLEIPEDSVPIFDSMNTFLGIAIQFIPGYTYTYSDSDSIATRNSFYLISMSERNDKQLTQAINDKGNYNYSYVVTTSIRYGNDSDAFKGQFYPSIGLTPFGAQNHFIACYITEEPLAVKTLSISNGLNFYPNPAREEANLHYNLGRNARQVSVNVFDVTGNELQSINAGSATAGDHDIKINTRSMPPGMYFYSFTVDGQTANGKFVLD